MDIDEEALREGRVISKLYGYLKVPALKQHIQNSKSGGYSAKDSLKDLAYEVVNNMKENVLYFIEPGSTTKEIPNLLNLKGTLLGIDAILNKKLIGQT